MLVEILFRFFDSRLDCITTRLPVGRANFAMFVNKLECLNQTESLIYRTSNWQVIDCDLTQDSLRVDNEQASVKKSLGGEGRLRQVIAKKFSTNIKNIRNNEKYCFRGKTENLLGHL
jgi:hypothetical protein